MARSAWLAAAVGIVAAAPASAGSLVDRVRQDGVLHCAAIERPGFAEIEEDRPSGQAADLCRRVAQAVLGPNGRFALRLLDLDSDFDRVRRGEIELSFLEPRTVAAQRLGPALADLGEAYRDRFSVLLPQSAVPQSLADLGGQTICFMIGDPVWPLLAGRLAERHTRFRPFGFSEKVEMKDAYNVGRCGAIAGLASTLDDLRGDQGVRHLKSRLLAEPLGPDPVDALVPAGDPAWAAVVRAGLPPSPPPAP